MIRNPNVSLACWRIARDISLDTQQQVKLSYTSRKVVSPEMTVVSRRSKLGFNRSISVTRMSRVDELIGSCTFDGTFARPRIVRCERTALLSSVLTVSAVSAEWIERNQILSLGAFSIMKRINDFGSRISRISKVGLELELLE